MPRLPHARGGVSFSTGGVGVAGASSPRPWGCFRLASPRQLRQNVFPTPVGVFPRYRKSLPSKKRLPHARGGVSEREDVTVDALASSPRPWGCFHHRPDPHQRRKVFPTPVGVFLISKGSSLPSGSLPHARGGVSYQYSDGSVMVLSSPRPWGCFLAGGRGLKRSVCASHPAASRSPPVRGRGYMKFICP